MPKTAKIQDDLPGLRLIRQEVSTALDTSQVAAILQESTKGQFTRLAKLSEEIEEKDHDISQALQVRSACIKNITWDIIPGYGDTGEERAKWVKEALLAIPGVPEEGSGDFNDLISYTTHAFLPGMSVSEILWEKGGTSITGFNYISASHFNYWESYWMPRLLTKESRIEGVELPPGRFLIHRHLPRAGDPSRGGLIRPLAWVYIFKNTTLKDLLRYNEKFGIPYLLAKVEDGDKKAFEKAVQKIQWAIKNFGPDGGSVVGKSVDFEFITPNAGAAGDGSVFFQTLSLFKNAVAKVLLGQTSTSDSDSSNRSTADVHNLVRHDLQVDDVKDVARTINQQLIAPLARNKFGQDVIVPKIEFDIFKWTDLNELAEFIKTSKEAGFELVDEKELSKRAGMEFKKKEIQAMPQFDMSAPGDNGKQEELKEEETADAS